MLGNAWPMRHRGGIKIRISKESSQRRQWAVDLREGCRKQCVLDPARKTERNPVHSLDCTDANLVAIPGRVYPELAEGNPDRHVYPRELNLVAIPGFHRWKCRKPRKISKTPLFLATSLDALL